MTDWVYRTYDRAFASKITASDFQYTLEEAKRLLANYIRFGSHAELCENEVFKSAMRSACEDEFACKLKQNNGYINFMLLLKLGVFKEHNARPSGIGKTAMALYLSIESIAKDFPLFEIKGLPVFSLSTQQLVCLSNCSKPSVIKHKNKLLELGLLRKINANEIPIGAELNQYTNASLYSLPELNEDTVKKLSAILRIGQG